MVSFSSHLDLIIVDHDVEECGQWEGKTFLPWVLLHPRCSSGSGPVAWLPRSWPCWPSASSLTPQNIHWVQQRLPGLAEHYFTSSTCPSAPCYPIYTAWCGAALYSSYCQAHAMQSCPCHNKDSLGGNSGTPPHQQPWLVPCSPHLSYTTEINQ